MVLDPATLLPPTVVWRAAVPTELEGELLPQEEAQVARAGDARRLEFRAGRLLARAALAELGIEGFALLAGEDRAPRWPAGTVGSISHTRDWCAVALTRDPRIPALGIDGESARALPERLLERVCTARERDWLHARPAAERPWLSKLFFSAKESFYKCQYPLTGRFLGFADVELAPDP